MPVNAPINQRNILNKLQKYLAIQAKRFPDKYKKLEVNKLIEDIGPGMGHCSGLSGLWLYRKSLDQESVFLGNLHLIADWNETEAELERGEGFLLKIFEQTLNDLRWIQNQSSMVGMEQKDLVGILASVGGGSSSRRVCLVFCFKKR